MLLLQALTKKVAEERNANKHAHEAGTPHPLLETWKEDNPKPIVRSWLASQSFTHLQVDRVEAMFETEKISFSMGGLITKSDALGGLQKLHAQVTTEAEASAAKTQAAARPKPKKFTQLPAPVMAPPTASARAAGGPNPPPCFAPPRSAPGASPPKGPRPPTSAPGSARANPLEVSNPHLIPT